MNQTSSFCSQLLNNNLTYGPERAFSELHFIFTFQKVGGRSTTEYTLTLCVGVYVCMYLCGWSIEDKYVIDGKVDCLRPENIGIFVYVFALPILGKYISRW